MARNEDFSNGFWDHPDIEPLSADATLLFIWSWTNPRCGMAGIYEVGRRAMTECKVPDERLDATLDELAEHDKALYEKGVLFVLKRTARVRTKSIQVAKSAVKDLLQIPDGHPLRDLWLRRYGQLTWIKPALTEARISLTNTSGEPQKTPDSIRDSLSLTDTSVEALSSLQVSGRVSGRGRGSGGEGSKDTTALDAGAGLAINQDELPEGLPEKLREPADSALAVLRRVHSKRGGIEPTRFGVGLAVGEFDDRDHCLAASALEHWALAGTGRNSQARDWVRTFRTFLERSPSATPVANAVERAIERGPLEPATPDDEARWASVVPALQGAIDETVYAIWLDHLHPHGSTSGLLLGARPGVATWTKERFGKMIAAFAECEVEIVECACGLTREAAA